MEKEKKSIFERKHVTWNFIATFHVKKNLRRKKLKSGNFLVHPSLNILNVNSIHQRYLNIFTSQILFAILPNVLNFICYFMQRENFAIFFNFNIFCLKWKLFLLFVCNHLTIMMIDSMTKRVYLMFDIYLLRKTSEQKSMSQYVMMR